MFQVIRGDLDAAIKSNTAYLKIHALAADNREIFDEYNRFAEFWTLNTFALQTTFFIVFGRIFDPRADSYSIQKLVEATIANPALFSKAALRKRKRDHSRIAGQDPDWLVAFVKNAWEPTSADLLPLRAELNPHHDKSKAIYQPIRHRVYAHRSIEDGAAISALFDRTLISDIGEILCFLDTLLSVIWEMAWNGRHPDLTNFAHYEQFIDALNRDIEAFIRQLA
jgi:hypothetical protein